MSSSKKLTYFNINGLAEMSRYILHYGGHKFEDVRHDMAKWPITEVKDSLPYGKMPIYEENGRQLNQSAAIARYVGAISGLVPDDPWEQAVLDAAVLTMNDFMTEFRNMFQEKDPTKKDEIKQKLATETVPYFLSRFEKQVKENKGHFGKKLSWADFVFLSLIENIDKILGSELEKGYPALVSLVKELRALPGVKEYIANRPATAQT